MTSEEMLKKLINESINLEEKKKLREQIRRENFDLDDHHGRVIGSRTKPPEDINEK